MSYTPALTTHSASYGAMRFTIGLASILTRLLASCFTRSTTAFFACVFTRVKARTLASVGAILASWPDINKWVFLLACDKYYRQCYHCQYFCRALPEERPS